MCYTGAPTQGSIADAATDTNRIALPFTTTTQEVLTQVSVRIQENLTTTGNAESGPLWVEAWLIRTGTVGEGLLLDQGYVTGGSVRGLRSIVGMIGRVGYSDGDFLQVFVGNDSGATAAYQIDFATDNYPLRNPDGTMATDQACQGIQRLSTRATAIWEFKGTILENAASGNHTLTAAPAAGDEMGLLWGAINNGDAAGRNAFAAIQDSVPVSLFSLLSVTGAAVSIASTVTQNVPNSTSSSVSMTGQFIHSPDQIAYELDAVLITKTTTFWMTCRISGRKPVSTLASTGAAPTLTKVIDRVQ